MIQVKEFDGNNLEGKINEWLLENSRVEIIDIKYSTIGFANSSMCESDYFGCALVIYKV